MSRLLFANVFHFLLIHLASADGASLLLGNLVLGHVAVRIFVTLPRHEPIPMDANHMEPVIALVDSHEVNSVGEALPFMFPFIHELLQAYRASALDCVVVESKDFSHLLV